MKAKTFWQLLKFSALEWREDSIPRFSAALSYYTFFAMAPLTIIAIAVSGIFFGRDAAEGRLYSQLEEFLDPNMASAVQAVIRGAWKPSKDVWAMGLGILVLLIGAIGVLSELKGALNIIWRVRKSTSALVLFVNNAKLLGFLLGAGFLLMVSLMFNACLALLGVGFNMWLPWSAVLARCLDVVFQWLMVLFVFAAIFKWLPDARIAWRDVWIGSAFTAALFLLGKVVLGLYLQLRGVSTAFGAAGSLVIILVWVYYSSLIFYFGAEFTKVYANSFGSHVKGR